MLKVEFWDDTNILDIRYSIGWRQQFYIDALLSHPEYPLDEEGKENVEGVFSAEFQRWRKTYHFDFVAPEYVADALSTLPMHEHIMIDGLPVKDVTVEVDWQGAWAVIDIAFVTDEVIRGNCCTNLTLVGQQASRIPPGECYDSLLDPCIGAIWDTDAIYTDPLDNGVNQGDRYLVITAIDVFTATSQGDIYEFGLTGWVLQDVSEGDGVTVGGIGKMYFDGTWWHCYPYIAMIDQNGVDSYHITGYALPETWVQVQYSLDNLNWTDVADPIYSDTFNIMGLTVSLTEGDYWWRINSWTWSCDYDPNNSKFKYSGFWLINDGGDYFLQNGTTTDKWYR